MANAIKGRKLLTNKINHMKDKKDRDIHYKNRTTRLADGTWDTLKDKRLRSNKSWNLFIVLLLNLYKKYGNKNRNHN